MNWNSGWLLTCGLWAMTALCGCNSPYHADRGALFGGLTGAGVGAIVGDAVGNAGAGTAIGAGVGALSGAAIGQGMDEIEAKNRAMIEQQLGQRVAPGAVSIDDVVMMTRAGVAEELIVNHVRAHGMIAPLQTHDLITLQQQGVSTGVIRSMQAPPVRQVSATQPVGTPVIVEQYHYAPPPFYWGPPPCYHPRHHWRQHHRPGVSWGMSFGN